MQISPARRGSIMHESAEGIIAINACILKSLVNRNRITMLSFPTYAVSN